MKAKTKCPNCGEIIETDCEGCIEGGTLVYTCPGKDEWDTFDVKWKIIEE